MIDAPVMLVDSGVVPAAGGSWIPDLEKMQSLTRDHVVIEEMRVWARCPTFNAFTNCIGAWPLTLITASMQVGRFNMTNGYVGLAGLGDTAERYGQFEWTSSGTDVANMLRWRFPRPMFVEAGTPISPIFRWQNPLGSLNGSSNVNVTVAFLGRTVRDVPRTTCVPFVSDYTARLNNTNSQDNDLMNQCNKPLNVQGLGVGLYVSLSEMESTDAWIADQVGPAYTSWGSIWGGPGALIYPPSYSVPDVQIKISDYEKFYLVPQFTPLGQVGGPRMWFPTPGYVLPPRGYLRVEHKVAPGLTSGPGLKTGPVKYTPLPNITLNGWREEALQ